MSNFFLIYIFSGCLCFLFYINLKRICKYLDIYDKPNIIRKTHLIKTPAVGGIFNLIVIAIFLISAKEYFLLLFISLFTMIGICDDKYNLSSNWRLIASTVIIAMYASIFPNILISELFFSSLNKSVDIKLFAIPLTILCILLLTNALNMMDGINSYCSTFKISALVIILLFILYAEKNNIINTHENLEKILFLKQITIIYITALSIFTIYNFNNKVFLGDSGSYLSGSIFAYLLISVNKIIPELFSTEVIFLIFLLPGIDMLRLFVYRIINKKSPFKGDRNHYHHILQSKYSNNFIVIISIAFQALSVLTYVISQNKHLVILLFIFLYFLLIYQNRNSLRI